jgi:hypothetical protein
VIEAARAAGTRKVILVGGGGVLQLPPASGSKEGHDTLLVSDGWASSMGQMTNPLYKQVRA